MKWKCRSSNPAAQRKALKENGWLAVKRTLRPHVETIDAQWRPGGKKEDDTFGTYSELLVTEFRLQFVKTFVLQHLRCPVNPIQVASFISPAYCCILRNRRENLQQHSISSWCCANRISIHTLVMRKHMSIHLFLIPWMCSIRRSTLTSLLWGPERSPRRWLSKAKMPTEPCH